MGWVFFGRSVTGFAMQGSEMKEVRQILVKGRDESFRFYIIHNMWNVGIGCKERKEVIGYGIRNVEESRNLRRFEVKTTKGGVRCLH